LGVLVRNPAPAPAVPVQVRSLVLGRPAPRQPAQVDGPQQRDPQLAILIHSRAPYQSSPLSPLPAKPLSEARMFPQRPSAAPVAAGDHGSSAPRCGPL